MKETTKAEKECPMCEGSGERYHASGPVDISKCRDCHGLGWLPQPGDGLTPIEAEALICAGRQDVEENQVCFPHASVWFKTLIPPSQKTKGSAFQFRVTPAQEQSAEKVENVKFGMFCYDEHEQNRMDGESGPTKNLESVEEAANRCLKEMVGQPDDSEIGGFYTGFHFGVDWILSLTPAQLEALRKEKV